MCRPAVMWSHGSTSSRVRCRVTYQSGSRPSAAIASSPAVEREVLAPLLEGATRRASTRSMTRPTRRSPRLAIPSANVAAGSCHFTCAARALGRVAQQRDLAPQLVDAVLAEPLERRVRLRHEAAERHGAAGLLRVLAADVDHVLGERRDAERVLVGLGGKADHEVELDAPPARLQLRFLCTLPKEVTSVSVLVDDVTHPLCAGLRSKRQPALLAPPRRDKRAPSPRRTRRREGSGAKRSLRQCPRGVAAQGRRSTSSSWLCGRWSRAR